MSHLTIALDVPSPEKMARPITVALGKNRQDTNFKNTTATLGALIELLSTFQIGPKDGLCLLQGELVGGNRIAKNVIKNDLMILDIDTGASVAEVGQKIIDAGLFALTWTTHSFGKDTTEIAEEQFLRWAKKSGTPLAQDDAGLIEQLKTYLADEKRYHKTMIDSLVYRGRHLVEGGMKYIVGHAPMPKLRVMFVLSEPFDFTAGASQKVRIEEWKEAYARVSAFLDIAVDSSCVDPSRLMYTPRIPEGATIGEDQHEIYLFDGDFLDLAKVPQVGANYFTQFAEEEKTHHAFETAGLMAFAKKCPDFDVVGFMQSTFPDDLRGEGVDPDKSEWACPNEESHTVQSATDRGFFVATKGDYWHAQCLHDGCKHASNDDRLWYLDKLCVKAGITDAKELEAWSAAAQEAQQDASQASHAASNAPKLDDMILALNKDSPLEDLDKVLVAVGMISNPLERDQRLDQIINATDGKHKINTLKSRMKDLVAAAKIALGVKAGAPSFDPATGHAVPEDLEKGTTIWVDWDWDVQVAAAKAQLRKRNRERPSIFMRDDNHVFRIAPGPQGTSIVEEMTPDRWLALVDQLRFKETDLMTGRDVGVPPPRALRNVIAGASDMKWPPFKGIAHVAMFGKDGKLHTTPGYDASLQVYFDPNYEALPIPDVLTQADVDEAVGWLCEATIDFPFSDKFEGGDDLPIYTDELDETGHPVPNLKRGESSRAHVFAAILQQFARAMIDGPTPGYHIDKPAAGTGAGYLVNVISVILNGHTAVAQTLSDSNEEFRKEITATLREGAQMIFVDNINRKVDSGDLAAALTTGRWKSRKLGVSENIDVPVNAMWLFAGNNLSFSHELMRRLIPIRMDAQTQNPAKDRDKTFFKYNPLQDWLVLNRPELIRACQIIIKWWVQNDMPSGAATLNSFDHWARVMGGILDCAGVPGFLGNIEAYLTENDDDDDLERIYAEWMYERYECGFFTTGDGIAAVLGKNFGNPPDNYPVKYDSKDDSGNTARFAKWMTRNMRGRTYVVTKDKKRLKVSLMKARTENKRGWSFSILNPDVNEKVD